MPGIGEIDRTLVATTMERAHIPGVSVASVDSDGTLATTMIGITDKHATPAEGPVEQDTVFGAASLSKAVFAYLVLKLIDKGQLPEVNHEPFGLNTPLSKILPLEKFFKKEFKQVLSPEDIELSREIKPWMLLAHTSGISDFDSSRLHFRPGTEYEYSGIGMVYLQRILEMQTGKSLEALAKEEVFDEIGMTHSSFLPPERPHYMQHTQSSTAKIVAKLNAGPAPLKPPLAANSLHTTAADYALLMHAWMHDPSELMQSAFIPQVSLMQDRWARDLGVSEEDCSHLAWGLGVGLEVEFDEKHRPRAVRAFHTGDMNQWRGWCAMDLEKREGIVYFANGRHHKAANGHVLSDLIIAPKVEVSHAQRWFFQKFGFARDVAPGWREREQEDGARIHQYLSERREEDAPVIRSEEANATNKMSNENVSISSDAPSSDLEGASISPFRTTPGPFRT